MMSNRMILKLAIAGVALGLTAAPAFADAIDGDWCSPDGKHLNIKGPALKTPGGAKMTGNYTRHAFSYVVPAPEPNSGSTIYMSLMNETTVQVREGTPVAQPIIWKRCEHIM
jgi:hypothetical protein